MIYRKERSKHYGRKGLFATKDFTFPKDLSHCICQVMGLKRFLHRGKKKANTQWNLFTIVHNMKKIHRYGLELA